MVKLFKKLTGASIRVPLLLIAYPLSYLLLIFKYADKIANHHKIIIDRLVEKGGQRKRPKIRK